MDMEQPSAIRTPLPGFSREYMHNQEGREYISAKGRYTRSEGRGMSEGYAKTAWDHLQRIENEGSLGHMCTSRCPFEQNCYKSLTPNNLLRAHYSIYGTKVSREQQREGWKYVCEKTFAEVKLARRSLVLGSFTRNISDGMLVEKFMVDSIGPVCSDTCRISHGIPDGTWNQLVASARSGQLREEQDWDEAGMNDYELTDNQKSEAAETTIVWWMIWLDLEDQMPNEAAIQHRVVVWEQVHEQEYKPDMEWFGMCTALSRPRWTALRLEALKRLSIEYYGADEKGAPSVLLTLCERPAHSNFAACVQCHHDKKSWADFRIAARGGKVTQADARKFKEKLSRHIQEVKDERMKSLLLSNEAASRVEWTYELDDACGSDYMYWPLKPGRESVEDANHYKYRFAMQVNLYLGHLSRLSLILPCVVKGGNFGCTAHFSSLLRMHELGVLGSVQIRQTDGGPDNDCATTHAYHWSLVHFGVCNKLTWFRLPPKHSHNKADRVNSMVKEKICPKRGIGGGCLAPWDFSSMVADALKSQSGRKEMAWHCANINWDKWFETCNCISPDVHRLTVNPSFPFHIALPKATPFSRALTMRCAHHSLLSLDNFATGSMSMILACRSMGMFVLHTRTQLQQSQRPNNRMRCCQLRKCPQVSTSKNKRDSSSCKMLKSLCLANAKTHVHLSLPYWSTQELIVGSWAGLLKVFRTRRHGRWIV